MSNKNHRQPHYSTTKAKYLAIQKRFHELYHVKRLRYDDCIEKVQQEYFIAHAGTVRRILTTEVEDDDAIGDDQLKLGFEG